MKLINCPICKKKFLSQGLKNHIINTGKAECYRVIMNLLHSTKNKPYSFSPGVMLKQIPHIAFIRRNLTRFNK